MVSVTRDLGRSWAVHPSDGELEVAAWTSHLSTMRNIMEALEEKVKTHRDKAASRIQASSCQTTGIIVRCTGVYICWTQAACTMRAHIH